VRLPSVTATGRWRERGEDAAEVTFPTCISVLSCPAKGMVSHVLIIVVAVIKRADAIPLRQPRRSV
jgi:hypothetical protein